MCLPSRNWAFCSWWPSFSTCPDSLTDSESFCELASNKNVEFVVMTKLLLSSENWTFWTLEWGSLTKTRTLSYGAPIFRISKSLKSSINEDYISCVIVNMIYCIKCLHNVAAIWYGPYDKACKIFDGNWCPQCDVHIEIILDIIL